MSRASSSLTTCCLFSCRTANCPALDVLQTPWAPGKSDIQPDFDLDDRYQSKPQQIAVKMSSQDKPLPFQYQFAAGQYPCPPRPSTSYTDLWTRRDCWCVGDSGHVPDRCCQDTVSIMLSYDVYCRSCADPLLRNRQQLATESIGMVQTFQNIVRSEGPGRLYRSAAPDLCWHG